MNDETKRKEAKGNLGEKLFEEHFLHDGRYDVAEVKQRYSPIDYVLINKETGNTTLVQIKTQEPMSNGKIGFTENIYNIYIKYPKDILIIFVDYKNKKAYGKPISALMKYAEILKTQNGKNMVNFPIQIMQDIWELTKKEIDDIKNLTLEPENSSPEFYSLIDRMEGNYGEKDNETFDAEETTQYSNDRDI